MSTQGEDGFVTVEADTESSPQQFYHRRNLVTSPLLRLPAELIIKIFEHVVERDNHNPPSPWEIRPALLVLTAVCQELRNIGITIPRLWGTVDLTIPPLAELYLQRCNYDPHILKRFSSHRENQSLGLIEDPRREAVWAQLEGRLFKNLHSLEFRGMSSELEQRIVPILRTATNLSSLELEQPEIFEPQLPWYPTSPLPRFSILRLRGFSISWTSPLLRNLTQLIIVLTHGTENSEPPSFETFLTALANCPDLKSLKLSRAGLDPLNGYPAQRDVVVQLRKLRELSLYFERASVTGCVLSHIRYPESAFLEVGVPTHGGIDVSEAISQALPRSNADVLRPFQRTRELTVNLDPFTSEFSAEKSTISCCHLPTRNSSQRLSRSIRKVLEIVGKDVIALSIEAQHVDLTGEMWESFLHGFPLLEQIRWRCVGVQKSDVADPFVFAFSRPFEGGLVCP